MTKTNQITRRTARRLAQQRRTTVAPIMFDATESRVS